MIRFEWDAGKAESNWHKHKITFEEAAAIFGDPHILTWQDRIVDNEERWSSIGYSEDKRLIFGAYTYRIEEQEDEVVRIISARQPSPRERRLYGNRTL